MKALLKNKKSRIFLWFTAGILAACLLFVLVCNAIVIGIAHPHRETKETLAEQSKTYDCILVLGAGVKEDGTPSNLLRDRLNMGLALLEDGRADVLLLTGDSQNAAIYDEVGCMSAYAVQNGAPDTQILKDPLGLSTYESLWRAKNVYGMESVLIVTQNFHLDRALYLADALGLECAGVVCDVTMSLPMNHIREAAARVKALFDGFLLPEVK